MIALDIAIRQPKVPLTGPLCQKEYSEIRDSTDTISVYSEFPNCFRWSELSELTRSHRTLTRPDVD